MVLVVLVLVQMVTKSKKAHTYPEVYLGPDPASPFFKLGNMATKPGMRTSENAPLCDNMGREYSLLQRLINLDKE